MLPTAYRMSPQRWSSHGVDVSVTRSKSSTVQSLLLRHTAVADKVQARVAVEVDRPAEAVREGPVTKTARATRAAARGGGAEVEDEAGSVRRVAAAVRHQVGAGEDEVMVRRQAAEEAILLISSPPYFRVYALSIHFLPAPVKQKRGRSPCRALHPSPKPIHDSLLPIHSLTRPSRHCTARPSPCCRPGRSRRRSSRPSPCCPCRCSGGRGGCSCGSASSRASDNAARSQRVSC